jgi:hypothetical protein
VPRVRGDVSDLYDGFWVGWLDLLHLIHSQLGNTGNTALSLFYTLCSSPLHTHWISKSSPVVTWQRIFNRLTVTSNHTWGSSLHSLIHFLPFLLNHLRLPSPKLDPILAKTPSNDLHCPFIIPRHGPRRKRSLSIVKKACLLIRCLAMDILLLSA